MVKNGEAEILSCKRGVVENASFLKGTFNFVQSLNVVLEKYLRKLPMPSSLRKKTVQ